MTIIKKTTSLTILFLFFVLIIVTFNVCEAVSSNSIEEEADTVLKHDIITTGEVYEYSNDDIIVNDIRYIFCKNIKIYNMSNRIISVQDLEAAEEVTLFENNRCARKIKVLRFGQ